MKGGRRKSPTSTTPQGGPCHGPPEPVRVAAAALLNLARWCRQRWPQTPAEDSPCLVARPAPTPPVPTDPTLGQAQRPACTLGPAPRDATASAPATPGSIDGPDPADHLDSGGQQ